jgi:hypothetical protein
MVDSMGIDYMVDTHAPWKTVKESVKNGLRMVKSRWISQGFYSDRQDFYSDFILEQGGEERLS